MTDSLRDQLLGLGFKPAPTPAREGKPGPHRGNKGEGRHGPGASAGRPRPDAKPRNDGKPRNEGKSRADAKLRSDGKPRGDGKPRTEGKSRPPGRPRTREDIDLAKAYAIRAQKEKDERIEAERQRQEQARLRREARARLDEFLKGRTLNDAEAEIARHFSYGGKIKRVYVNADQLRALNAGELGVVQHNGRYVLVTAADLAEAESIFAAAVALRVDPDAPAGDDPYADPKYQVPDDLVW
jgi:uncharacterized protein YaiL (DUF2058 family)